MVVDLRLPSITGATEKEQLLQIKNFLYQHVSQLQWALNNISKSDVQVVTAPVAQSVTYSSPPSLALVDDDGGAEARFAEIKPQYILKNQRYDDLCYAFPREHRLVLFVHDVTSWMI